MSEEMNELERQVISLILAGEDPSFILRKQFQVARLRKRELTGHGFYASLLIPDSVERLPDLKPMFIGDVSAEIDGLECGAGFVLHVENGVLDFLEGYTYGETWPARIDSFRLSPGAA